MKKIKIGIFIRDFKDLSDTEFRIYQTLLESHYCEISLLIKDAFSHPSFKFALAIFESTKY